MDKYRVAWHNHWLGVVLFGILGFGIGLGIGWETDRPWLWGLGGASLYAGIEYVRAVAGERAYRHTWAALIVLMVSVILLAENSTLRPYFQWLGSHPPLHEQGVGGWFGLIILPALALWVLVKEIRDTQDENWKALLKTLEDEVHEAEKVGKGGVSKTVMVYCPILKGHLRIEGTVYPDKTADIDKVTGPDGQPTKLDYYERMIAMPLLLGKTEPDEHDRTITVHRPNQELTVVGRWISRNVMAVTTVLNEKAEPVRLTTNEYKEALARLRSEEDETGR